MEEAMYFLGELLMSERIRLGDKEKLWDSHLGKHVEVTVVSITAHHVVLRKKDGKLWCMTRSDFTSLRALGRSEAS
jgi:hypothetical protein